MPLKFYHIYKQRWIRKFILKAKNKPNPLSLLNFSFLSKNVILSFMVSACPQAVSLRKFKYKRGNRSFPNTINIEAFVVTGNRMLHPK